MRTSKARLDCTDVPSGLLIGMSIITVIKQVKFFHQICAIRDLYLDLILD